MLLPTIQLNSYQSGPGHNPICLVQELRLLRGFSEFLCRGPLQARLWLPAKVAVRCWGLPPVFTQICSTASQAGEASTCRGKGKGTCAALQPVQADKWVVVDRIQTLNKPGFRSRLYHSPAVRSRVDPSGPSCFKHPIW